LKRKVGFIIYCIAVTIPLLEGLLWLTGFRPYQYVNFLFKSEPTQCIIGDPVMGFGLNPGSFKVTINQHHTYDARHSNDGLRVNNNVKYNDKLADIALFGCSYTYGLGVSSHETMTSLLQEFLPKYNIINHAVPGYGNVQGYLQLHEQINKGKKPSIAIFNFADFHMERNLLLPSYRLHLNIGYRKAIGQQDVILEESTFPYIEIQNNQLEIRYEGWGNLYKHWQGREYFATVNLLQNITDKFTTLKTNKFDDNLMLFLKIKELCDLHGIRLIVTGLNAKKNTYHMLSLLKQSNIEIVDISLPLEDPQYNHAPHDTHPNVKAHRHYAELIFKHLSQRIL